MRVLLTIAVILICAVVVLVMTTYPRFNAEMQAARERLLVGSKLLKTDQGEIEYSIRGEGTPVLVLHGAGAAMTRASGVAR